MTRSYARGALAGLIGGLIAGAIQSHAIPRVSPFEARPPKGSDAHETADVRTARLVWDVPKGRERLAGSLAHYALAGGIGAAYGALAERWPPATAGRGAGLGLATWTLDELASPALGLAEWPARYDATTHAYGLTSNLAYGLVVEGVRRGLRGPHLGASGGSPSSASGRARWGPT